MRVLVCGDRDWRDDEHHSILTALLTGFYDETTIGHLTVELSEFVLIEGGALGADEQAAWWADVSPFHSHNESDDDPRFEHIQFKADWDQYGKAAGPIRNQKMLDEGRPDVVFAFHDDFVNSKGTRDMVRRATKADVPVYLISRVRA